MKYTERRLLEEIRKIKKGCGNLIGVPIFVKFKPCGETYKGKFYFCGNCAHKLEAFKIHLKFYKLGTKESKEIKNE